jgi:hypothetical protein
VGRGRQCSGHKAGTRENRVPPLLAGLDFHRRLQLQGALSQLPRLLLPQGKSAAKVQGLASWFKYSNADSLALLTSVAAELLDAVQKASGYEVRSSPGMVSGTTNSPPAAACTLEFDTDLLGGDLTATDGALHSFPPVKPRGSRQLLAAQQPSGHLHALCRCLAAAWPCKPVCRD